MLRVCLQPLCDDIAQLLGDVGWHRETVRHVGDCHRIALAEVPDSLAGVVAPVHHFRPSVVTIAADHAVAAVRVIDMDRQEAPLVVVRIEQRQLLVAVHHIDGIVDVQRDVLRRPAMPRGLRQPVG